MKTFVRTLIIATLLALALTGSAFSATKAGSKSELPKWECIHCGKSVKSATKPAPDFCQFSYWSEEHDWVRVQ